MNKLTFLENLHYLYQRELISRSKWVEILIHEGFSPDNSTINEDGFMVYSMDLKTKYEKNRRL